MDGFVLVVPLLVFFSLWGRVQFVDIFVDTQAVPQTGTQSVPGAGNPSVPLAVELA